MIGFFYMFCFLVIFALLLEKYANAPNLFVPQLNSLSTVRLFRGLLRGREGLSPCHRGQQIGLGTMTGPATHAGGRTSDEMWDKKSTITGPGGFSSGIQG